MADPDQKPPRKRAKGAGRPAWVPPNLDLVKALASQGMKDEKIAETLGIGLSTLYRKKAQLREFREAIKRGNAESEAVATSKLFEAVKRGEAWAICFFLKARHGWRESDVPGGVNVNINGGASGMTSEAAVEAEKARAAKRRELLLLLTPAERRSYLELLRRAAARQDAQRKRPQPPAIEVQARPVEPGSAE